MTKKRTWNSSDDLLGEVHDLFDQLRAGEVPVEDARVLSNLIKQGVKVVELEFSAARLTGRIKDGSSTIPGFKRGG